MFEYIQECGVEQLLNTTLSAKAQIYLLLHLVCPVDREILDDIYNMKREMEDIEKRELLYNMNLRYFYLKNVKCNKQNIPDQIIERSSLLLIGQIRCLYPGYIRYFSSHHEFIFKTPLTKTTVRGHKDIYKSNIQFNSVKILNVIHRYIENREHKNTSIKDDLDNRCPYYNNPYDVNFWSRSNCEKFFDSMKRNIEYIKKSCCLPEHLPIMDTITVHTNYKYKLRIIPPSNCILKLIDCFKNN